MESNILGTTFTMRLVEPMKSGFQTIAPRSGNKVSKKGYGSGKETLRFKANGNAAIENEVSFKQTILTLKFNQKIILARRYNTRRNRRNQCPSRFILWYQRQRTCRSNLGFGIKQNKFDGLR